MRTSHEWVTGATLPIVELGRYVGSYELGSCPHCETLRVVELAAARVPRCAAPAVYVRRRVKEEERRSVVEPPCFPPPRWFRAPDDAPITPPSARPAPPPDVPEVPPVPVQQTLW